MTIGDRQRNFTALDTGYLLILAEFRRGKLPINEGSIGCLTQAARMEKFDVVIIGCGPCGIAVACEAKKNNG